MDRWTLDDVAWKDVTADERVQPVQAPDLVADLEAAGLHWAGRIACWYGKAPSDAGDGTGDEVTGVTHPTSPTGYTYPTSPTGVTSPTGYTSPTGATGLTSPGGRRRRGPKPPDRVREIFLGFDRRTWIEVEDSLDGPWAVAHSLLEDGALVTTVQAPVALRGGANPDAEERWLQRGGVRPLLEALAWLEGSLIGAAVIDRPGVRHYALACEAEGAVALLKWHASHVRVRGAGVAPVRVDTALVLAVARRKDHVARDHAEAADVWISRGSIGFTAVELVVGGVVGAMGAAEPLRAGGVAVALLIVLHLMLGRAWNVLLDGADALGPDLPIVVALAVPVAFFGGLAGGQVAALAMLMLVGESVTRLMTVGLRRRWVGAWMGGRRAPSPVPAKHLLEAYAP